MLMGMHCITTRGDQGRLFGQSVLWRPVQICEAADRCYEAHLQGMYLVHACKKVSKQNDSLPAASIRTTVSSNIARRPSADHRFKSSGTRT